MGGACGMNGGLVGNLKQADHFEGLDIKKATDKCLYACLEDIWGVEVQLQSFLNWALNKSLIDRVIRGARVLGAHLTRCPTGKRVGTRTTSRYMEEYFRWDTDWIHLQENGAQ
jgi:hypothetical protein